MPCADIFRPAPVILFPKGVKNMKLTGLAISMGVGLAAGAVTAMLLPKESAAHKIVQKAADAVGGAATTMGDKISNKLDTM